MTEFEYNIMTLEDLDDLISEKEEERKEWTKDVCNKFSKYKIGQKFRNVLSGLEFQLFRVDLYRRNSPPELVYTCRFLNKRGLINQKIINYYTVYQGAIDRGEIILID